MFTYTFGEKKYTQDKIKLGQLRQLLLIIEHTVLPTTFDTMSMIKLFGERIHLALAIILKEDAVALKDKDIDALAAELEFEVELDQILEIVNDFFDCNDLTSLLTQFQTLLEKQTGKMQTLPQTVEVMEKDILTE